jgi:hypothetical protein
MPMRGEIQVSAVRPQVSATRSRSREPWMDKVWGWIAATIDNPEFFMIVLFCTIGLWLTFYFIHFFPDYGAMAEALETLP